MAQVVYVPLQFYARRNSAFLRIGAEIAYRHRSYLLAERYPSQAGVSLSCYFATQGLVSYYCKWN
ncbi:MAG: hypothetical protein NVS3B11_07000 [Collimonas sp.]